MQRKPPFKTSRFTSAVRYPRIEPNNELIKQYFMLVHTGNLSEIIDFLTTTKLPADVQHPETNESAYHIILKGLPDLSEQEKLRLIKTIYIYGSNINTVDNAGAAPIHYACREQYFEIAKFLVGGGRDCDIADVKLDKKIKIDLDFPGKNIFESEEFGGIAKL